MYMSTSPSPLTLQTLLKYKALHGVFSSSTTCILYLELQQGWAPFTLPRPAASLGSLHPLDVSPGFWPWSTTRAFISLSHAPAQHLTIEALPGHACPATQALTPSEGALPWFWHSKEGEGEDWKWEKMLLHQFYHPCLTHKMQPHMGPAQRLKSSWGWWRGDGHSI